jgi:hypothetical protein|tara:strand:+ start:135 stop:359 length:225 start_codon:yes stop_codon:yes gene_type:complete
VINKLMNSARPLLQRRSAGWFPLLLIVLAFGDLRTELILLADHFTLTAMTYAIRDHQLAIVVLLSSVSLWRRYR